MSAEARVGGDMTLVDRIVYYTCRTLIVWIGAIAFRVRVEGRENVPRTGGCVIAPVHRSNFDTPILGCITRRRMRYMGKDTLWNKKYMAWFVSALGGFPVVRGTADREALRSCQAVLERGEPLVMFPEGTRKSGPVVQEIFDGPAFVASRAGVPIVPVGIGGSERVMPRGSKWIRPKKVVLIVGKPIVPPHIEGRVPRRVVTELTEQLHQSLQQLFDEADVKAGAR
ncbi:MAG: lysophospholipid acyltransferase family protein [Acidimicrobiales bacterium]